MKYILGFAILFKKYRGISTIRVFSDNILIDELLIEDEISIVSDASKKKVMKDTSWRESFGMTTINRSIYTDGVDPDLTALLLQTPEKIFLYEIDELMMGNKIRFEMYDKNSNYNNGFMSKSNMVLFHMVFLIPKNLLAYEPLREITQRYLSKWRAKAGLADKSEGIAANRSADPLSWPSSYFLFAEDGDGNVSRTAQYWFGGKQNLYVLLKKKFGIFMIDNSEVQDKYKVQSIRPPCMETDFLRYIHIFKLLNT